MVKHHARKNEARGRRSATGETHRQAVDAVRRGRAEDVVDGGGLVLVVDYVPPALDGAEPCPECGGKAVSGQWFEQPSDGGRPPLAVASACTACMGCGRAEHDGCAPGVHVDEDEDDVEELLDDELDEDQDQGEPCPSCGGRDFYVMPTAPSPTDQADGGPFEELLARARARGVRAWDVTGAAVWGELDELLGEGAQALAEAAQRATVYLLTPCGCTEGRVRTVRRAELGGAA